MPSLGKNAGFMLNKLGKIMQELKVMKTSTKLLTEINRAQGLRTFSTY